MTPITKTILTEYEVRKTGKQKQAFRQWLTPILEQNGWAVREEKGSFGARNLVIGDPDTAKVIYTAHYDTCVRLPFPNFITPKSIPIYVLYQILLTIVILVAGFAASFLAAVARPDPSWFDTGRLLCGSLRRSGPAAGGTCESPQRQR